MICLCFLPCSGRGGDVGFHGAPGAPGAGHPVRPAGSARPPVAVGRSTPHPAIGCQWTKPGPLSSLITLSTNSSCFSDSTQEGIMLAVKVRMER